MWRKGMQFTILKNLAYIITVVLLNFLCIRETPIETAIVTWDVFNSNSNHVVHYKVVNLILLKVINFKIFYNASTVFYGHQAIQLVLFNQ